MPRVGSSKSSTSALAQQPAGDAPPSAGCRRSARRPAARSSAARSATRSLDSSAWARSRRGLDPTGRAGQSPGDSERGVDADRLWQEQPVAACGPRAPWPAPRGRRRAGRRNAAPARPPRWHRTALGRSAPKIARSSSVRPEPTSPAMPRISPRRTSKLTSRTRSPRAEPLDPQRDRADVRACRASFGHGFAPHHERRPSRRRRARGAGRVATSRPSRSTVMRSAIRRISSSRWLM